MTDLSEIITAAPRNLLSSTVYDTLRSAILSGDIAPGTKLVELALAKQFEVSRAPLREALVALRSDGLVVERSSRDTRVIELGEERIRELHLLRGVLETLAYQEAAHRISPKQIEVARQLTVQMDLAESEGDTRRVGLLDYEFHRSLAEFSGMASVAQVLDQQHVLLRMWINTNMSQESPLNLHMGDKHRLVLDAVTTGTADEIGEAVVRHIYLEGAALAEKRHAWMADHPRLQRNGEET